MDEKRRCGFGYLKRELYQEGDSALVRGILVRNCVNGKASMLLVVNYDWVTIIVDDIGALKCLKMFYLKNGFFWGRER